MFFRPAHLRGPKDHINMRLFLFLVPRPSVRGIPETMESS